MFSEAVVEFLHAHAPHNEHAAIPFLREGSYVLIVCRCGATFELEGIRELPGLLDYVNAKEVACD